MVSIDEVRAKLARFEKSDSAPIAEGPLSNTEKEIREKNKSDKKKKFKPR